MKSTSLLTASLASAIVSLSQMATAIQLSDFTATQKKGECVDSAGNIPAYALSPPQTYTTDAAMQNWCVRYCGQNLANTFLGFETIRYPNTLYQFFCSCDFNLPTFPGNATTPFPYQYTPFPAYVGNGTATTIVDGSGKDDADGFPSTAYQCYKYNGAPTGTASPTGVHTPAPTAGPVGASDFTSLGEGECEDSAAKRFSFTASGYFPWTNVPDGAANCTSWCGQNVNANFRAFAVDYYQISNDYRCKCYFDLPGQMPPYYGYVPPREHSEWNYGTGSIVKIDTTQSGRFCYKWNGTSGGGTLHPTKAPTKPGSGTLHPTKAPTKPGSGTLHPTKAPTKPGSCPVGHPSCADVADCSGSVFSHCLDGCCASLGSKSAKKTKSSKRV